MIVGEKAMCKLSIVPVRAEHRDQSEIITQLLFGEIVTILERHNQWLKIEIAHDGYQGWVDHKQLHPISHELYKQFRNNSLRIHEENCKLKTPWGNIDVLRGSPLLFETKKIESTEIALEWINNPPSTKSSSLKRIVNSYLNAPYLWGGRTKYGIDCSGFTQTVFHQLGVFLPRDSSQQAKEGTVVDFKKSKIGDLAFFISEKTGIIIHVGVILANSFIIHAHGRVRIDKLTTEGIYNEDEKYYSHKLSCIKRYTFK